MYLLKDMSDETKSLTCCIILLSDHSRCHQDMSGTEGYDEGVFLLFSPHLYFDALFIARWILWYCCKAMFDEIICFFVRRCFWIPWVVSSWPMMAMPFWERWIWIPLHNFVKTKCRFCVYWMLIKCYLFFVVFRSRSSTLLPSPWLRSAAHRMRRLEMGPPL